ncbi:threonine aldolase family protein [Rhabdaerophilum sp.]|uniref:threonine aldolase family protein n=1 Tax=Rhabdaerophilum sp. TaxID=2717341 RepID=UPI0038D3FF3C
MIFQSDNVVGASPKVLDAIVRANAGTAGSYGADPWSQRFEQALMQFFDCPLEVFLVATGTAANALAASAICPPWGALLTHVESHVMDDECGAPEFYMGGAKLVGLPGIGGKVTPETLDAHVAAEPGGVRRPPLKGLSIAQGTEFGLVYTPDELMALTVAARRHGLKVHMDGARFSNALVSLGCTPAEMTWKSGIDVLSLGGTKNGCLMAEAVVFFDRSLAEDFRFRRKRAGQTLSKQRLMGAQFEAWLEDGHWRELAAHSNGMARRMAEGLAAIPGIRLGWRCEINEVFPVMPQALMDHLIEQGARFYDWSDLSMDPALRPAPDEVVARLVTSFMTTAEEVDRFVALSRNFMIQRRDAAE